MSQGIYDLPTELLKLRTDQIAPLFQAIIWSVIQELFIQPYASMSPGLDDLPTKLLKLMADKIAPLFQAILLSATQDSFIQP